MDSEGIKSVSVLRDFKGLMSDISTMDIPEGAMAEQVNCFSKQFGSLETRGALKEVELSYPE